MNGDEEGLKEGGGDGRVDGGGVEKWMAMNGWGEEEREEGRKREGREKSERVREREEQREKGKAEREADQMGNTGSATATKEQNCNLHGWGKGALL